MNKASNERTKVSSKGINAHAIAKYQCIKLCVDCGLIYRMSKIMRESEQQSKANHTTPHYTTPNRNELNATNTPTTDLNRRVFRVQGDLCKSTKTLK